MRKNLLITGAGVDRTNGINFPLAATLLPEITTFSKEDGKCFEAKLREIIPNLRFTFTSLITRAIESISTRDVSEQRAMIKRLDSAIKNLPDDSVKMKKHGQLLVKLFNKLAIVAENAEIDDEIRNLIKDVFENNADEYLDSDSILDINKMSLSETFKSVLRATLRLSLNTEHHEIAQALGAEMLNIENLLIDKFLGFYNNKQAEIKNYIYISWMLWGYLVFTEKKVFNAYQDKIPFYSEIPKNCRAITLNYTSFLEKNLGKENVIYFHGGLSEYVRMDRRELSKIDKFYNIDILEFIDKEIRPNMNFNENDQSLARHIIPALVPPLKLKPILSSNYIEKWHNASEWIKSSEKIVIIGYSFNTADEHFNDIIRQNFREKTIIIVAPDIFSLNSLRNFHKIFGVSNTDWTTTQKYGITVYRYQKIYLYQECADKVDLKKLFDDDN